MAQAGHCAASTSHSLWHGAGASEEVPSISGPNKRDGDKVLDGVRLPRDHKLPNPNSSLPGSGNLGKSVGG